MRDRIERLIKHTLNACIPWVQLNDGIIQFIDPLDKREISAHYGATHMAASLIIYGNLKNDETLIKKGEGLLFSVLDRWDTNKEIPDFHHDFNNFALCVLNDRTDMYEERIKEAVLNTRDTVFDTVNWLPMRWYVNNSRYEWTGKEQYKEVSSSCSQKIIRATYSDGFIDDMLPKGRSFSLQYDVATVAFMQYLRVKGEDIDLSDQTGALLNAVYPDGDINYFGRGTNQIFAWGLWIYLLASSGQSELDRALGYLEEHLDVMLENHNIMLNDFPGEEKYMWWDYHYCSVYTAHLLFWLILALEDFDKRAIEPKLVSDGSSGVHISRNDDFFVVTFDGRTEYLAEKGPSVAAVWTKKSGTVLKGLFGPWYGLFGNKYIQHDAVLRNYLGLIRIESEQSKTHSNRIISKLRSNTGKDADEKITPFFVSPQVDISDKLRITYNADKQPFLLNIPSFNGTVCSLIDGKELMPRDSMRIRNQYGWVTLKQEYIESGKTIEIEIS